MEDPTTVALNLTFFGTLAVAFVMFVGFFIAFVLTLVLAGLGRGMASLLIALASLLDLGPAGAGSEAAAERRPGRKEPRLPAEWAEAPERKAG